MGVFKPFSSCNPEDARDAELPRRDAAAGKPRAKSAPKQPNPNPRRFVIERVEEHGVCRKGKFDFVIAQIHYPDCVNHEGRKLLLYAHTTEAELRAQKFLDPHFCNHKGHLSPIARFEPNAAGWYYARVLVGECVPQGT